MPFCPKISFFEGSFTIRLVVVACLIFKTSTACLALTKVKPSTIIVSLEGDATVYNIKDDFEVNLTSKSIGKKIDSKSIIKTQKNGTLGLLFSNGTLITIKPGSRFFLREYSQKIISAENLPEPSKLEEEPSQSKLLAHLDFGELVVKVPKLKKGSTMNLTSPLGTAGIRGTMFQMMAVRNEITGDIMGGVNLISGDIQFTNTNGVQTDLFSGQSIQLATSRLGETRASETGGLVNLTKKFGSSLTQDMVPQPLEILFPNIDGGSSEGESDSTQSDSFTSFSQNQSSGWDSVHDLASEIFFEIEESENSSESFSFTSLSMAQGTEVPNEVVGSVPVSSAVVSVTGASDFFQGVPPQISLKGDKVFQVEMLDRPFSEVDPWINATNFLDQDIAHKAVLLNPPDTKFPGTYQLNYQVEDIRGFISTVSRTVNVVITPPTISLYGGRQLILQDGEEIVIPYLVQRRIPEYPVADDGPFQFHSTKNNIYPGFEAVDFAGRDLSIYAQVYNEDSVDYTKLGQITQLTVTVSDLPTRKLKTPEGDVVSTLVSPKVQIIDNLPPLLSLQDGPSEDNPMRVEGVLNTFFVDPGISILDNYDTQQEIEQHLGLESGAADSAFGFVNMEIAGIYRLDYQEITDKSGNEAETLSRWVEVFDITPPVMTLYGADPYFVDVNASNVFNDPGAFAIDNLDRFIDWEDGNGRIKLSIEKLLEDDTYEPVETTIPAIMAEAKKQLSLHATFRLTYTVQDVVGNESSIQRQLVLINSPFPEPRMVMHGDRVMYHEVNTEFLDPGVTVYKELGSGLEPINLSEYLTINAFLVDSSGNKIQSFDISGNEIATVVDATKVNYFGPPHHPQESEFYVDPDGERIPIADGRWRKLILEYIVVDQFGNTTRDEREVRIQDTIDPVIVLNEGPQGVNFPDQQGGRPYVEPGATITDNYDEVVTLNAQLYYIEKGGDGEVDEDDKVDSTDLGIDGFSILGDYIMRYEAIDSNDNKIVTDRRITVIDTIPPQVALVTHDFFDDTSLSTFNTDEFGDSPIVNDKYPIPTEVGDVFEDIPSQFAKDQNTSSIFALTLQSNEDFYVVLESDPEKIIELLGESKGTVIQDPISKRWRGHYSAFTIKDGSRILTDPGVYARNDTEVGLDFKHTFDIEYLDELKPDLTTEPKVLKVVINYTIKQESGEVVYMPAARSIYFLDINEPNFFVTPSPYNSLNPNEIIAIEAGAEFYDSTQVAPSSDIVPNPSSGLRKFDITTRLPDYDPSTFEDNFIQIIDARDRILTEDLIRIIYRGPQVAEGGSMPEINQPVVEIFGDPPDQGQITSAIPTIAASQSDYNNIINRTYRIKYIARDKRAEEFPSLGSNEATFERRFIVKDTIPPRLIPMDGLFSVTRTVETVELDYLKNNNKNLPTHSHGSMTVYVDQEESVKEYLAKVFEVVDFDPDFDYDDHPEKWEINIDDGLGGGFKGATKFPETQDEYFDNEQSGYNVSIRVTDDSGRTSEPYEFKLAVIDNTPPEIHLIGDAEIHDFFRFGQNNNLANNELPFPDRDINDPSNTLDRSGNPITYMSSGFAAGEHRMMLGEYNFIEPGVYAEDFNGDFNVIDNYPDLDGDGYGEVHGFRYLGEDGLDIIKSRNTRFANRESGEFDFGVIYAWTDLEDVKTEQVAMGVGSVYEPAYNITEGIDPVDAKIPDITGDGLDFNSSFEGISYVSVERRTYKIFYIVKDSWHNVSDLAVRIVHIYKSQQFPGYAFYATPIVNGVELSSYYDTNGTSDNFLSSIRKDYDGDGVSDFWEAALTDPNSEAHLNPSMVGPSSYLDKEGNEIQWDGPWHDPTHLTQYLAYRTLTVDGQNFLSELDSIHDRTRVLLDGGTTVAEQPGGFMWFDGLNFLSNYSVRGARPDGQGDDKILFFDFNKKIP